MKLKYLVPGHQWIRGPKKGIDLSQIRSFQERSSEEGTDRFRWYRFHVVQVLLQPR